MQVQARPLHLLTTRPLRPPTPETVLYANAIGDSAVVYTKGESGVRVRTIKCHSHAQAQAVCRFWQVITHPEDY